MNSHQSSQQFAAAERSHPRGLSSDQYELVIRQQPQHARVAVGKEKDRKPIDPPPIIQLKIDTSVDPQQNFLQSPYFFMSCSLIPLRDDPNKKVEFNNSALSGTLVSSLHRLKDADNQDGGFFVFGDLSVKIEGKFRLKFSLYEMNQGIYEVVHLKSVDTTPFTVHASKNFPGMAESTFLTRSFSDQGVRLRLRKEPRALLRRRGPAADDYVPRHYGGGGGNNPRRQSQADNTGLGNEHDLTSQMSREDMRAQQYAVSSIETSRADHMANIYGAQRPGHQLSASQYNLREEEDLRKRQRTQSAGDQSFGQSQQSFTPSQASSSSLPSPYGASQQSSPFQYQQQPSQQQVYTQQYQGHQAATGPRDFNSYYNRQDSPYVSPTNVTQAPQNASQYSYPSQPRYPGPAAPFPTAPSPVPSSNRSTSMSQAYGNPGAQVYRQAALPSPSSIIPPNYTVGQTTHTDFSGMAYGGEVQVGAANHGQMVGSHLTLPAMPLNTSGPGGAYGMRQPQQPPY